MCASFFSGVNARPTVFRIGCCITGSDSGFTIQIYGFFRTIVNRQSARVSFPKIYLARISTLAILLPACEGERG